MHTDFFITADLIQSPILPAAVKTNPLRGPFVAAAAPQPGFYFISEFLALSVGRNNKTVKNELHPRRSRRVVSHRRSIKKVYYLPRFVVTCFYICRNYTQCNRTSSIKFSYDFLEPVDKFLQYGR